MSSQPVQTAPQEETRVASQTLQYTLLGSLAGILFPVIATTLKAYQLGLAPGLASMVRAQASDPLMWIIDTAPFFLGSVAYLAGRRQDTALEANRQLGLRQAEISAMQANLEQMVADRTRELDVRNAQARAVIEFSREIGALPDLPSLLKGAADIIANRFGLPGVDLFMLDGSARYAVLRASSYTGGNALVKEGFRVGTGDQSVVSRAIRRGRLLISSGEAARPDRALSGAESGTRLTLPLTVSGRTLGALDLHFPETRPIGLGQTEAFQLIADQLAAAIENVRLMTETRATLDQLATLTAQDTRSSWQVFLQGRELTYEYTPAGVRPLSSPTAPEEAEGLEMPLLLRGQKIGGLRLRKRGGAAWTAADRELVEKVGAQVALALENVRLLEQTRQRAAQEQIIGEVSARLTRSLDVDAVLQAAVREFASLPDVAEAEVLLTPVDGNNPRPGR